MFRVSRLLPLLVAATAVGCVYPDLKMGTSTGGAGGTTTPGSLGGASGGSATGGAHSTGGVTGTGGATSVADARAAGGATGADVAADTVDAPRTVDTPAAIDAPRAVDAPTAFDAPAAVDAPRVVDAPAEGGDGAGDAGSETNGTVTCNGITCPRSCCNGNVCAASQTASMCGIGGAQCGACGPTGTTVAFSNGQAVGAMTGWGWVGLGAQDTVTDPTCKGGAMTATTYCLAGITWNTTNSLCISGSLPAVSALNPDYADNWGVTIGVDATINKNGTLGNFGQTLGQSFTSIAITVTGSPLSGLRAQVTRRGDPSGTGYCAMMTSGMAIPFTSFNTKCYDTPPDGVALTVADVPNIDTVAVQVSSGSTAIAVTDLCITGITFSM